MPRSEINILFKNTKYNPATDCIEWVNSKNHGGYGQTIFKGKVTESIEDNISDRDKKKRGKGYYGEKCNSSRLSGSKVKLIRQLYSERKFTQNQLVEKFNVN